MFLLILELVGLNQIISFLIGVLCFLNSLLIVERSVGGIGHIVICRIIIYAEVLDTVILF